jgi:hypothetical protein
MAFGATRARLDRPKERVDCGLNHHRRVSTKGSDVHLDAQYCGCREIALTE